MLTIVGYVVAIVISLFILGYIIEYIEEFDRPTEAKFFSNHLLAVGALGIVWYILIVSGFEVFRAGIRVAPLDTISEMVGVLVVPIVPTYFIARYLAKRKVARFHSAWISGTFILLAIMTVGIYNG